MFYVKIHAKVRGIFKVEYFYGTDLRYDGEYSDLPVIEIYNWLNSA